MSLDNVYAAENAAAHLREQGYTANVSHNPGWFTLTWYVNRQ